MLHLTLWGGLLAITVSRAIAPSPEPAWAGPLSTLDLACLAAPARAPGSCLVQAKDSRTWRRQPPEEDAGEQSRSLGTRAASSGSLGATGQSGKLPEAVEAVEALGHSLVRVFGVPSRLRAVLQQEAIVAWLLGSLVFCIALTAASLFCIRGGSKDDVDLPAVPRRPRPPRDEVSEVPAAVETLCPQLVVPELNECVLAIPITADESFDVVDLDGNAVLSASEATAVGRSSGKVLNLMALDGQVIATACPAAESTGQQAASPRAGRIGPELLLHRGGTGGEFYGSIAPASERGRYKLRTLDGMQLHFRGRFGEHAVSVTDDSQRLLATTEAASMPFDPDGRYYRICVAPLTDVGLVLLCVIAIDRLSRS